MKFLIFLIVFASTTTHAGQNLKLNAVQMTNLKFEKKAYELKIENEQALIKILGKEKSYEKNYFKEEENNFSCVEWVYKGPFSREEAIKACKGVTNMECVEFVYKGPSNREESAIACRNVHDMKCVKFMYAGTATRLEAVRSCADDRNDGCRENY